MASFAIVGKRFSPSAFADYVSSLVLKTWRPTMIVLHNTAAPTLKDRPQGFTPEGMEALRHYYADVQGWNGGPHLFVDQVGIWVFTPLDRPGVHSPSWNHQSWGVEMLGDFAKEPFDSGLGARVRENAVSALATLFHKIGIVEVDDERLRLHKEDPKTTHDCPGRFVGKAETKMAIQARLPNAEVWVYRNGAGEKPTASFDAVLRGGTLYAEATRLQKATGIVATTDGLVAVRAFVADRYSAVWDSQARRASLHERPP